MNKGGAIAIYSRKSKFTGKGESIGNQVEWCKAYVSAHYGEEALENLVIYEDEGFSGGNLNRPAFKSMMKAAQKRQIKAIVVYRLDRISRNISDFSGLIETLSRLGVDFVSIREQFDTATPMGRAMMYIASVFSQLERETIAERIRDNMHELAKTGRWLGGVTPTGYASESVKSVTVDGKTKKACRLKLVPGEAETVKTIYRLFSACQSLTQTEAELIRARLFTKNGKRFTRFAIKAILQNPVYLMADQEAYDYFAGQGAELFADRAAFDGSRGILAYNRTDQEKGRATVYLPVREWIVAVGEHPGLVPGRVWVSVQEALEQNRSKSFRRPRSNEALLTGLVYCQCGSRMYPKLSGRVGADGQPVYAYVCRMKESSQRAVCDARNMSGNALDRLVIERIRGLEEHRGSFKERIRQGRQSFAGAREPYGDQLASLEKEKATMEKRIDALMDSLAALEDDGAKRHALGRMERMHQDVEEIRARIQALNGLAAQRALSGAALDRLRQDLTALWATMEELPVELKRDAVRALVRKVVWDGVNAHVILHGAPDEIGMPKARWGEDSK